MLRLLLLIFKVGKLGKALPMILSMLVTIGVYGMLYGWPFAVGFVALIMVHEMGHYIAARQRGLNVGLPTFIPFVGAWIDLKDKPHDVETEAYVGLAGPLAGTLGALACYYAGRQYDSQFLIALSYSGFIINLFNLIPVSPLDGGRVTAVLSPRIWFLGIPMLIGLFFVSPSPMLILVGIMALPQIRAAWHYDPKAPENKAYYDIKPDQRLFYTVYYLVLVGFLSLMSYDLHNILHGTGS